MTADAPDKATFVDVLSGSPNGKYLLASDAGYGFITQLENLYAKNKSGKALLSLPKGARVLQASPVADMQTDRIAAVTSEGRMLVIPLKDLPEMAKGKGNKIIGIPPAKVATREEYVVAMTVVPVAESLVLYAGKRHLTLKPKDLEHYAGERGRRGLKLPRGFQRIDAMTVGANGNDG